MSILNHAWGESAAVDRVWAQVAGIPTGKAENRLFMVLQAFCDESYTNRGYYSLGGYVASAQAWADFTHEWDALTPRFGVRDKKGRPCFHMANMWYNKRANIEVFYRVIEKYAAFAISCGFYSQDFRAAMARIIVQDPSRGMVRYKYGKYENLYITAYRGLMDSFHSERKRPELVELIQNNKVDFYFDEKSEKRIIQRSWDGYIQLRSDEIKDFYGHEPKFENDMEFIPLQAADFWAWWIRRWHEEQQNSKTIAIGDFGIFTSKPLPKMHVHLSEDTMAHVFKTIALDRARPGSIILDVNLGRAISEREQEV